MGSISQRESHSVSKKVDFLFFKHGALFNILTLCICDSPIHLNNLVPELLLCTTKDKKILAQCLLFGTYILY